MKKALVFLLVLVMVLGLTACGNKADEPAKVDEPDKVEDKVDTQKEPEKEPEEKKEIIIGLSLNEITDSVTQYQQSYEAAAEKAGVKVIVTNAKGSVDTQLGDIETLITREVDVIHIRPLDPDGVAPAIETARNAGIPVLVTEYDINCDVDCYLYATQNVCGELQAESLIEKLEADPNLQLNIGYLWGSKARGSSVQQRYQGFVDAMQSYIDSGRAVIVEEQEANFKSDEASAFVEDWLQSHPEMNCVVAQNDEMANGAIQALKTNGKDFANFYVLGINGTDVGKQNILDGYQLCTVDMHEKDTAVLGFDYACRLVAGETFAESIDYSGELFELITAANA